MRPKRATVRIRRPNKGRMSSVGSPPNKRSSHFCPDFCQHLCVCLRRFSAENKSIPFPPRGLPGRACFSSDFTADYCLFYIWPNIYCWRVCFIVGLSPKTCIRSVFVLRLHCYTLVLRRDSAQPLLVPFVSVSYHCFVRSSSLLHSVVRFFHLTAVCRKRICTLSFVASGKRETGQSSTRKRKMHNHHPYSGSPTALQAGPPRQHGEETVFICKKQLAYRLSRFIGKNVL